MKQKIYYEKDSGKPYVLDELGNHIPPMQLIEKTDKSITPGWDMYDTSQGHCAFCGKLVCKGYCFK